MLCSNCGKNEANVRYTRIINGEKTEFALCEDCAKKMGLEDIDFNIPINFSNFLSDFFEDDNLLPSFAKIENERCPKCGLTYDDFVNNGKFGCAECYDTFSNKLDSILKNLHGTSKHIGRKPKNIVKFLYKLRVICYTIGSMTAHRRSLEGACFPCLVCLPLSLSRTIPRKLDIHAR